jgi:xanthine/uracil permease
VNSNNITVAMSPQLAVRLKERCGKEGVSVTSVITGLVVGYLGGEAFPPEERG